MGSDLQKIIDKLDPEEQEKVRALLNTVAMQAELIADMSHALVTHDGASALQRNALQSVTLTTLAQKLSGQVQGGPTVGEINQAVTEMRNAIQKSQAGQEALQTVFGFAMKVAPLLLV